MTSRYEKRCLQLLTDFILTKDQAYFSKLANTLFPRDLRRVFAPTGCIYGQFAENKLVQFAFTQAPDLELQEKGWVLITSKASLLYLERHPITLHSRLRRPHREIIRGIFTAYFKWLTDRLRESKNDKTSFTAYIYDQPNGNLPHDPSFHLLTDSVESIRSLVRHNSDGSITIGNGKEFLEKLNLLISSAVYFEDFRDAINNPNSRRKIKDSTEPLSKKLISDIIGNSATAFSHDSKLRKLFDAYDDGHGHASIPFSPLWPFVKAYWNGDRKRKIHHRYVYGMIKTIEDVRRLFAIGPKRFIKEKTEEYRSTVMRTKKELVQTAFHGGT